MTTSVLIDQKSMFCCMGELTQRVTGNQASNDEELKFDHCNEINYIVL